MACATLKRSLDFDPVHTHVNPTKRQRCAPMVISPSSSPPSSRNEHSNSVFSGVCPKMSPDDPNSSRFSDYDVAEMMAAGIREEIRRLHRKKQLHFNPKLAEGTSPADTSSDSPGSPTSFSSVFPASTPDKPLFTFRQVGLICERLITERENQIREEYDRFLSMKLSEQYEAFVKFSNDQLHKRFDAGAVPSYLS
ncbi:akirin isoform X1 [Planococcus citri]|uniref:akirin isoform X1 n=1 Tax=Planococcus citri TaxID=170843 RepID=UPI0031F74B71